MKKFNKTMNQIMEGTGTELTPNSDTNIGSFGNSSTDDMEQTANDEKLVMHLEGGIEIHIPTAIYDAMGMVLGDGKNEGEMEEPMGMGQMDGTGSLCTTGDCPFDKDGIDADAESNGANEASDDDDNDDADYNALDKKKTKQDAK